MHTLTKSHTRDVQARTDRHELVHRIHLGIFSESMNVPNSFLPDLLIYHLTLYHRIGPQFLASHISPQLAIGWLPA